ncbi:MAG: phosphotransferase [Anaerolineales bacterium]|nr:phosphotransferase [Anaerolineales bacterium]
MNRFLRLPSPDPFRRAAALLAGAGLLIFASACGTISKSLSPMDWPTAPAAASQPQAAAATSRPASQTAAVFPTAEAPTARPPATPTSDAAPFPTAAAAEVREERILEVEWPPQMRLGDSDTMRLSLIPSREGYTVTAEFEEHAAQENAVTVTRMAGYSLRAAARVDAAGFLLSPAGEQVRELPEGEPVTWRWTLTPRSAGRQRVSLILLLRWMPLDPQSGAVRERELYSRSLTVEVTSFLGLTARQAAFAGLAGLGFGGAFTIPLAAFLLRPKGRRLRSPAPNPALRIELPAGLALSASEQTLLRVLFRAYARITLEAEFRSGYSGARTFLVQPVRADGRSDAYTIAKLGDAEAVRRERDNYEAFVKDTLPPITARIQESPVMAPSAAPPPARPAAALRYTFIGEPGRKPVSLRAALLENPDPAFLERLFATFGPGWWMQRRPYAFRASQEYDRVLPAHFVIAPAQGRVEAVLDGRAAPSQAPGSPGQIVRLKHWRAVERRPGGESLSLRGDPPPGQPALRVRWMSGDSADGALGRIIATRRTLLDGFAAGLDLHGLQDPLAALDSRLAERIQGTQSILHGDLNLENILAGPGGTVWLIDFAQTREGHALADFAHLQVEIVAHILAPMLGSLPGFADILRHRQSAPPAFRLLDVLEGIAGRCLFNPSHPREYRLALYFSALGALKYSNLDALQRNFLYLYAAVIHSDL